MAFFLRRVFSSKCFVSFRFTCHIVHLSDAQTGEMDIGAPIVRFKEVIIRTKLDPFWASRRGFAKGRKLKDESNSDTVKVAPDIGPTVKSNTLSLMEAGIAALSRELSKIRTGRATTGMLDHIIVEARGVKMSLNRVAVVSAVDAHTLSVTPYDPNVTKFNCVTFN